MLLPYRLEFDNHDPVDVVADARDLRAWEAEYGQSWLYSQFSHTQAAQLAYIAGKRTGQLNAFASWKDFDAHCTTARSDPLAETTVVGNPTQPGPTDDSSAP